MSRVLYLHGFASSPQSRKAIFFRDRLAASNISLVTPDLAGGDFRNLTLTGQLEIIKNAVGNDPVCLIGSSMGGYLASLYAADHPNVTSLVLLAPAFELYKHWINRISQEALAAWRTNGEINVYHYGAGRELPLSYSFLEDAAHYPPFPDARQPCLIFHGINDPVVPVESSETFERLHPSARLVTLQSGHELTDVLEDIWDRFAAEVLQTIAR